MSTPWRSAKVYRQRNEVAPYVADLEARLVAHGEVHVCGSWRRNAHWIGDLDVIVVSDWGIVTPAMIADLDGLIEWDRGGAGQIANGNIELPDGHLHVDLYGALPADRGAFLWFLTGPKNLNIQMRARAQQNGWQLSQYGLTDQSDQRLDDGTEQSIAQRLGYEHALEPATRERWAEPKRITKTATIESSDGSTTYTLTFDGDKVSCTCPGFKYRRRCRHTTQPPTQKG
jgi:DNA polymerase/3'-5' exonuclease PolX